MLQEVLMSEGKLNRGLNLDTADIYVVCNKLETGVQQARDRHASCPLAL